MVTMPHSYHVKHVASHLVSEWRRNATFDFTEIINNCKMKRGTACQIVRFISHLKHFHSNATRSVSSNYYEKVECKII